MSSDFMHQIGKIDPVSYQAEVPVRTIRHIKRYANGLRLTLTPIAEEVDLVDFLAIELLRVFHPEVYLGIVAGKEILAPMPMGYRDGIPVDRVRQWFDKLCEKASPGFQEHVRSLLRELFPELARVYSNTHDGEGYHAQWRKDCRVCSPAVFDKFFLLAIPEGEVSEVEMRAFVDGVGDEARTKNFLARARESGRARRFMERLEDFTRELPMEAISPLVRTLFDEGDSLRFESRGLLDITADMQVPRIIYQCLSKLPTEQERQDVLLQGVRDGSSLYTVVQQARLAEPKDEATEGQLITVRTLWEPIRDAALVRIEEACTEGTLWEVHGLPSVLFAWLRWREEATVRASVDQHVQGDEALISFIAKFAGRSHSHTAGDKVARSHIRLSKKVLGSFLDIDTALARLRRLSEGTGELAEATRGLVVLLERKSDGPWDE